MRVERRLAVCFGLGLLLLGGRQSVLAQSQPGVFQMNPGNPPPNSNGVIAPAQNFTGPAAAPTSFNGSLAAPEYTTYPSVIPVVPPNMPPDTYGSTINPYPAISPYDYSYQNDSNVGGIWEHTERTRDRKWYFSADFLFMSTKPQQGIFGNPNAQTYVRQESDFINGTSSSSSSGSSSSGSSSSGSSSTNTQLLQDEGFITQTPAYYASLANYYNALDLGTLGNLITEGGRFTTGFWNPDNSGVQARFWFGGQASDNFNAQDDNTQNPKDMAGLEQLIRFLQNNNIVNYGIGTTTNGSSNFDNAISSIDSSLNTTKFTPTEILENNLLNLRGLPVADNTANGQTIPYDIYFDVKTTSQQIGTNLDYYFTPIYERKWIMVNPSVGVTYMNIKESLSFLGIDSGLLYGGTSNSSTGSSSSTGVDRDFKGQSFPNGIDDNQDGIIDNAILIENGPASVSSSSGSGSSSSSSSSSSSTTFNFDPFPSPFALLPATIDISASSNIVGPTGGLRYMLGSKTFHIIGETKFGVMADFEQISLSGDNIGSTTRVNGNVVTFTSESANPLHPSTEYQQDLIIPTPANPNPNAFSSSQTHAHVSPYFEQSVIAEAPVLQYIPYVNKISLLSKAQFRLGYTFIWIGNVINTNESVLYQGDPMAGMFPEIQPTHSGWWTQNMNLGVSWEW
jgi:hypothetical protein